MKQKNDDIYNQTNLNGIPNHFTKNLFFQSRHILKVAIIIVSYILSHSPTQSLSLSFIRNQKICTITSSNKIRALKIEQDSSIAHSLVHPHMHVAFLDTLDIKKISPSVQKRLYKIKSARKPFQKGFNKILLTFRSKLDRVFDTHFTK